MPTPGPIRRLFARLAASRNPFLIGLFLPSGLSAAAPPLEDLRPDHPRLIVTAEDFATLRQRRARDPVLDGMLGAIERGAAEYLDAPPLEREQEGRRMLATSRRALRRITWLAMTYHLTGDGRYARRAEAELLNVSAFADWNPGHYLDTAEMTAAVGLGYDWLYHTLDEPTRVTLRSALLDKGLAVPRDDWGRDWRENTNNWNAVCFGGMVIGALAIAEDEPEVARRWLADLRGYNPRAQAEYTPDGVYPEGPGYWSYGTSYQVMLIEALRSAIGTDFGLSRTPGFLESGAFMVHARGPTGLYFNFADNEPGRRGRGDLNPTMLWIAAEAGRPDWLAEGAAAGWEPLKRDPGRRFAAFNARYWLRVDPKAIGPAEARSWSGGGKNPVAVFREHWDGPDAMYLAVKGGRPDLPHGHQDTGSFVFDADGVRWASDLGRVRYHDLEKIGVRLWDRRQDADRWRVYRYSNEAHNVPTVGGRPMRVDRSAPIAAYEPLTETNDAGRARITLDGVFGEEVEARREFVFDAGADRRVEVHDRILTPESRTVAWTFITHSEVRLQPGDPTATLQRDGRTLRVSMATDQPGAWSAEPYRVPDGYFGPGLPGVTRLQWRTRSEAGRQLELHVVLRPGPGDG